MTPDDERHFLDAAEEGRVEEIRQYLAHGTSPDAVVDGWTALEKASIKNQCEVIKVLIEAGADPNRADEDGITPLYWTAKNGHADASGTVLPDGKI